MSESGGRPKSDTGARPKTGSSRGQSSASTSKDGFKQSAGSPIRMPDSHFETGYQKRAGSAFDQRRRLPFKKNWNRSMYVGSERSPATIIVQPPSRCDSEAGPSRIEVRASLAEVDTDDDSVVPTQELSKCPVDSAIVNPMPMEPQVHTSASEVVPTVLFPKKSFVQRFYNSVGYSPRRPRVAMNSVNKQKTFATYHSVQINVGADDSSRPRSAKNWRPASEQNTSTGLAVPIAEGAVAEVDKSQEKLLYEQRMVTLVAELGIASLYESFNDLIKSSLDCSFDEITDGRKIRFRNDDSLTIGEEICLLKPFVFMLFAAQINNYCSFCFNPRVNRPRECGLCKSLIYCDKLCQTWHWKMHAWECYYYQKHSPRWPDDFQRMVILIICRLKAGGAKKTSELIHGRRYTYEDLDPGLDTLNESFIADHIRKGYEGIKSFLGEDMVTYEEYITIYGKFFRNMVYISKPNIADIGIGLYLGLNAFHHSCRPIANLVFDGVEAVLVACRNMKSRYTEQMTFNRIRNVGPRDARLSTLNKHYNTSCNCAICEDKVFDKKLKEELKPKKAKELTEKASRVLQRLPFIHPDHQMQIFSIADKILKEMRGIYGPMHALRCEALVHACRACTILHGYREATFYYRELMKIYIFFFGMHHQKVVESLFRLAEAYFETRCKPEAQAIYACALSNTLLTFGEKHTFYHGAWYTYKLMKKHNFDARAFNRR